MTMGWRFTSAPLSRTVKGDAAKDAARSADFAVGRVVRPMADLGFGR
jgi:hypothetical protein